MFYFEKKKDFITLEDILHLTNSTITSVSDDLLKVKIFGVNSVQNATEDEITFLHNPKYISFVKNTKAKACFLTKSYEHLLPSGVIGIINSNSYLAFTKIMQFFYGTDEIKLGEKGFISPSASVSPSAIIGCNVKICENVVVSKNAEIGDNCSILPNTFIGCGVKIGKNSIIHDNCSIMFTQIGEGCVIRSGARVGTSGFGFAPNLKTGKHEYIPQISGVKIGDFVDIGANVTVDRGSFEDTKIGNHTKIDNLVHLGHGVEIGNSVFVAGQSGFAGSSQVGDFSFIGPQVGFANHIRVANFTTVVGKSGVAQDVTEERQVIAGTPAVNHELWKKMHIKLKRLLSK